MLREEMQRIPKAVIFQLLFGCVQACLAQSPKTIDCPADRVYRNTRDLDGKEFCEHVLGGGLTVRDGPFRFWYNRDLVGAEGSYSEGRQVGPWKECNSSGQCKQNVYETAYPGERQRKDFRPEIPLSFSQGKYVFDFASCRDTAITQTAGNSVVDLIITGERPYRCWITYTVRRPSQRSTDLCAVPYSVGVRQFGTLDLKAELPTAGLPQFCQPEDSTFLGGLGIPDGMGNGLAGTVDVECASVEHPKVGAALLIVRFNQYATEIISAAGDQAGVIRYETGQRRDAAVTSPKKSIPTPSNTLKSGQRGAVVCRDPVELKESTRDSQGRTIFVYSLSPMAAGAKEQSECISTAIGLSLSCR